MSPRPSRRPTRGRAVVLGVLLALGLAACSGGASDGSADSAGAPESVTDEAAGGDNAAGDLAGTVSAVTLRELVTTGSATLVVADPVAAAQQLARIVEQVGGRVEQRSEQAGSDGEPGRASMTLRIPADQVTPTIDALDGVGTVSDVTIDTVDVTATAQDLDARISALETSTDRLRGLMAGAASVTDLLEVERELSTRQAELDSLRAQREHLSDEVAMSTLRVDIVADAAAVTSQEEEPGFVGGLAAGWEALVSTVQVVVLVVGVLLPWLAVAALAYVAYRVVRTARRRRAPEPGTTPPATEPEREPARVP
ncbi:DUF4349 domain-containing protein [Antribacter sp. KLBMP9083]|uniref:DUF4349 domain-containing protein n=1 Tax=Antribacter soli TaxID=2910976 RepID=A0AA41QAC0_9MICO|nr:DUF4349 domain-containing protein [Antribacter soli]MCF4119793.1 DUF4349 domain-containing protein [Antribacter soli]